MTITEADFIAWMKNLRYKDLSYVDNYSEYQAMMYFASENFPFIFRLLEQEAIPEQICLVEILCRLETEKHRSHPDTCWRILDKMVKAGNDIFLNFAEPRIKAMVLRYLPRNLPVEMLEHLFHDDPYVRKSMLRLVGRALQREAVPHVILLLNDDVWHVQIAAVDALKDIASPEARFAVHEWEKRQK